jgi:hypothetical protein
VATLKVAHSEIPAEKCRGEAHLFATLDSCPIFLRLPKRPKGATGIARVLGRGRMVRGTPRCPPRSLIRGKGGQR